MANENDKVNFKGMTVIPSLSLNKHVSAVHNYSLQDAINMRMSDDRTHLQNIEDIINSPIIENFLNENKSIYGTPSYNDFIIENNNSFANVIVTYLMSITHDYQDEQDIQDAIINCYANVNFSDCTLDKLINLVQSINSFTQHDSLSSRDEQNIEEFIITFTILSDSKYNIIDVCACKNELVIFVKDLDEARNYIHKNMTIVRYNEKTNVIYKAYNKYFSYYNGKLSYDYTYNVNGNLILAFCEYDTENDVKVPLKTINLNEQLYPNADINLDEDKLSIKPGIQLSNFDDVYYQSGAGYTGWHYIYIQYKINEGRYTEWYRIGFPIKLLETTKNVLFTEDCMSPKGDVNVKYGGNYVLDTGYINKTYQFDFNIDNSFYQYRIGVIVANNTTRKYFVTEFINCNKSNNELYSFLFDVNKLVEEEFIVETRQNFYNVKNIINYQNRLYCSNYETFDFGNINTDDIKLYTKTINKEQVIIPEEVIDNVQLRNNNSVIISYGDETFNKNILWLLLSIDKRSPHLNILSSLNNIVDGKITILIAKNYIGGSIRSKKYTAYINKITVEEKSCMYYAYSGSSVVSAVYTYPIFDFVDILGNHQRITPFFNIIYPDNTVTFEEPDSVDYASAAIQGIEIATTMIKIGYDENITHTEVDRNTNTIVSFCNYLNYLDNPSRNIVSCFYNNNIYMDYKATAKLTELDLDTDDFGDKKSFSFEKLREFYPVDLIVNDTISYIEQKEYYLTTLPNNEVFDFYIHFINKYGEISDGYRLKNNHGLITLNNKKFVIFQTNDSGSVNWYFLPADVKIKDINENRDRYTYYVTIGVPIPYSTPTLITFNDLSDSIKNYFNDVKFKNLYTNNLANYAPLISNGSSISYFIPYYNGVEHLFKINSSAVKESQTTEAYINFNDFVFSNNIVGYFISYNKINFTINNVGVRIPVNRDESNYAITQFYSILNDILDYRVFNNFISDVVKDVKPFYVDLQYSNEHRNKIIQNLNNLIYKSIKNLGIAYAGENKYGRRGKSTILTELDNLVESPFIKGVEDTIAYISFLSNITNDFYLNEPTLYKFSNYYYNTNERVLGANNLGEWYELNHIIYNEKGVSYYYKVEDEEKASDTTHIKLTIETLKAEEEYKNLPEKYIPVGIAITKFISLHCFNLTTKSNPFQIGHQIFIHPINMMNYFSQFIKECWEYDNFIFQKYDINKQKNKYTNTIIYSNVINDESSEIKWNEFLTESYKFISENKGEIVNMFTLGNNIFIHCLNALYVLQFKDYLATTEESLQIVQSNIKDISYKELLPTDKGYCGLQDKEASVIGNFGYIFYENDTNRIFRFDNNELIYMDYPIVQWLKRYKPTKVRFANDIERNNLIIKLEYIKRGIIDTKILLYDYEINAFVSRMLDSNFIIARNTKNKLYFIKDKNNIKIFNNLDKKQDEITINVINLNNNDQDIRKITNKLSFIFNAEYDAIKFIENIEWNIYKYINAEDYKNSFNDPIEGHRFIYPGDYIRIYNDLVDTGWIDIEENSISGSTKEYNSNDITKPYYRLGKYIMNLFRNVKDIKEDNYSLNPSSKTYINADDRARLYGKWFIIEFGFNTKLYDDNGKTIEFENLKVNVSKETQTL